MKQRRGIDQFLYDLMKKYHVQIIIIFFLMVSVLIRFKLAKIYDYNNGVTDYNYFLIKWVKQYKQLGIRGGLRTQIGNYYVPYNVILALISKFPCEPGDLISLISCAADYMMYMFLFLIAKVLAGKNELDDSRKILISAMTVLPMVVINSTLFKQCDSIYSCFIAGSLYYFLKKKYNCSFLFVGVAICFKLQAIYILTFYIIAYFAFESFSVLNFLWIPAAYLAGGLPAVFCGRSLKDTYGVYFQQIGESVLIYLAGYFWISYDFLFCYECPAVSCAELKEEKYHEN